MKEKTISRPQKPKIQKPIWKKKQLIRPQKAKIQKQKLGSRRLNRDDIWKIEKKFKRSHWPVIIMVKTTRAFTFRIHLRHSPSINTHILSLYFHNHLIYSYIQEIIFWAAYILVNVMEILGLPLALASMAALTLFLFLKLSFSWWVFPILTHRKLKRCGFRGPPPSFPFGNIEEMKKKKKNVINSGSSVTHDIHPTVFPYFSRWQNSHGT